MEQKSYSIEMHISGGVIVTVAGKDLLPTVELMQATIDEGDIIMGLRPPGPVYTTVNGELEVLGEVVDVDFNDCVMEDQKVSEAESIVSEQASTADDLYVQLSNDQAKALGQKVASVLCLKIWKDRYLTAWGNKTDIGLGNIVYNIVKEFKTSSTDAPPKDASVCIDGHTIERMEQRGGSFAKALARCYEFADSNNRKRLQTAFDELFARYSEEASSAPVEKERVK